MAFFLQGKIEDIDTFKEKVSEMIKDPLKQTEVFDFLRDPQFMALLNKQPGTQPGYDAHATPKPIAEPPKSTTIVKA